MRPLDIPALMLAAVLVGLSWWVGTSPNGAPTVLRIHSAGGEVIELPLDQDRRVEVSGPLGATLIEVANGRARVLDSPCTARLCIRTGWLSRNGAVTACLPNQVLLEIAGEERRYDSVIF